jgi:hypothetical protein
VGAVVGVVIDGVSGLMMGTSNRIESKAEEVSINQSTKEDKKKVSAASP